MPYTEKRKQEILTSRALHRDTFNAYGRKWIRNKRANSWKTISRIFMRILLPDLPKKKYPQKSKSKKTPIL